MAQPVPADLKKFLRPYDKKIQDLALWVREFVRQQYRGLNETIWDAASAVAMGFSFTPKWNEGFCHIAVYTSYANLGFNHGARLEDPRNLLEGTGSTTRHLRVTDQKSFPKDYVVQLLRQTVQLVKPTSDAKNLITIRVMNTQKKRRPIRKTPGK